MLTLRSKRWSGAPPNEAGGAGATSNNGNAINRVSGLLGRLRQCRWRPECGVYIQVRRVEQVRVGGRLKGCRRAHGVPLIAGADIGQHVCWGHGLPCLFQLGSAPACARLRCRREKDFHVGVWKYDRSNVAPVEHSARRCVAKLALECEQHSPDLRIGRYDGGGFPNRVPFEVGLVKRPGIKGFGRRYRLLHVIERMSAIEQRPCYCPIDQSGIEVPQAVVRGKPPAKRTLAGRRRSVDRNDHGLGFLAERAAARRLERALCALENCANLNGCPYTSARRWNT